MRLGFQQNVVSRDNLALGLGDELRSRVIYGLSKPPVVSNIAVKTAFTIYPVPPTHLLLLPLDFWGLVSLQGAPPSFWAVTEP